MIAGHQITAVQPAEYVSVLRLLFQHLPEVQRVDHVDRLVADREAGRISLDGLFAARRQRGLLGAIWAQVQPGKTATIWPPRVLPREDPAMASGLLEAATNFAEGAGALVLQALVENDSRIDAEQFRRAGFRHVVDLLYLVSRCESFPTSAPSNELEFAPHDQAFDDRLSGLVERTYQDSQDCPALNGIRDVRDVLAGYRAVGEFDPSRWQVVRRAGADVGCLILADHPSEQLWELVYMGLVPEARGNGWGIELTRHAQWLARLAGRQTLMLGVDAENHPALQMYAASGFAAWDRRGVWVRTANREGLATG